MITTNTTASRAKADDGKRRVITTTTMKPGKIRFIQQEFPGVNKRELNKVDSKIRFNTTELDGLMQSKKRISKERSPAPVLKTPQPKVIKKAAPKKRKAG